MGKISNNYSPNFTINKRAKNKIKFIIIHYTGMKKETIALKKLCDEKSKVSAHYFIKKNGDILNLVPDLYEAWHAGKSSWKKLKSLNKRSIGIEIQNSGHNFKYEDFSLKQINSLKKLLKKLTKFYKIKQNNILGHSDIAPERKKDPGEKFPWRELSKNSIGKWYKKPNKITETYLKKNNDLFFKNLHNIGYRYFSLFKRSQKDKLIIKSFQQHFLPNNVTGKIDKKTQIISHFLNLKF